MKKRSSIVILLSFLILGGLIIWQIKHLKESHKLKAEIEQQQMKVALMQSAIELRKAEDNDDELQTDFQKTNALTNTILRKNFKKFNQEIRWGFYNGLGEPIDGLNDEIKNIELVRSSLKVCISCLIMIEILDKPTENEIDSSLPRERGYILDQTPAQMRDMQGLDAASLRYIHVYSRPTGMSLTSYIIPGIFLIALSSLFIWLFFLNNKQSKLIKQKNEFVNHLSHQFQTPLSSIKLSANLLSKKETTNQDELVQIIQIESSRLENHIKTILHWVKSDADRLHIFKEKISVTDIIERSLKQMKPVFLTNNTIVNFIPPEEELHILADVNHLQLMLFNIWENAIKHNKNAISLKVDCTANEAYICISTTDNGVGFQKNSVPEKFKGLGLAYINKIMIEHHGTMKLKSTTNQGLAVHLNFPNND
ncbi:MAG: HAMP domain-containing histidine kinase [Flavobacteriaceae bacterium]|nr:HAMP domain-containing histidine kinase [Flavobacteriaceae bacterium]